MQSTLMGILVAAVAALLGFWFWSNTSIQPGDTMDLTSIESPISRYHQGFIDNDPKQVLSALGSTFTMFNGSFSGDPRQWESHMFLTGENLQNWPATFISDAGPYENTYEVVHTYERGDSALVVTLDTGKNRFRSWEGELTTWLLGRVDGQWKIVGYFLRDIQNPS
jgi:hypothetical protein